MIGSDRGNGHGSLRFAGRDTASPHLALISAACAITEQAMTR